MHKSRLRQQRAEGDMSIHWSLRYSTFAASVYTLSLFFAGWRQVNQFGRFGDFALLAAGVVLTLGLLGVQGYWIYFDEKAKGTLKKRVQLFESIHTFIAARRANNNTEKSKERGQDKA
jgi:hypothetical protein